MVDIVDSWSRYDRAHEFIGWWPADEKLDPHRRGKLCVRCGQTRKVAVERAEGFIAWGCPVVPAWWRVRHMFSQLPWWDANTVPPWIK